MKKKFKAHPLMVLADIRPFAVILVVPVFRGVIQYISSGDVGGLLWWEILAFIIVITVSLLRSVSFCLECNERSVTIKRGIFLKRVAVIELSKISSVQTAQNLLDAVFNAVTYRINTEAGLKNKSDFEFKLSCRESEKVSALLYGKEEPTTVKFSVFKIAIMAATTSSAVTGMIIGVPILNKAGKLLGIALNEMLFDEINNVSSNIQSYFPPAVNTVSVIFLLGYAISFLYSLLRYINFNLSFGENKFEVKSGFFVKMRTAFKKDAVNNVRIEQSPLMQIFRRYAMKVSVGGYGELKSESAVIVPSASRDEIKHRFSVYFPFFEPRGKVITSQKDNKTKNRFLFWPLVYFILLFTSSIVLSIIFDEFGRLILFVTVVLAFIILFYARLCLFEYRHGEVRIGENIFARSIKGFRTCEMYCPKENIGQIKIIRYIPDKLYGTCTVVISIRSESADKIRVRHINYKEAVESFENSYNFNV